jgi:hypothetical protein
MGNETAKTYWGVTSVFNGKDGFVDAWIRTIFCGRRPCDRSYSETKGVVFENWFDAREKAFQYLDDVREAKKRGKKRRKRLIGVPPERSTVTTPLSGHISVRFFAGKSRVTQGMLYRTELGLFAGTGSTPRKKRRSI